MENLMDKVMSHLIDKDALVAEIDLLPKGGEK